MEYRDILRKLYRGNLPPASFGLDAVKELNELVGNPVQDLIRSKKCKLVHVTGSNGKGSVALKIAKEMMYASSSSSSSSTNTTEPPCVGLYTSPHLVSLRERITINGEMISKQDMCTLMPIIFKAAEEMKSRNKQPTFFEMITVLAYMYFSHSKTNTAIIEVGMGGRQDATNIIIPTCSVITSISLEHTHILGNTIQDICKEKSGIMKPGVPVFVGSSKDVPVEILEKYAKDIGAPFFPDPESTSQDFNIRNSRLAQRVVDFLISGRMITSRKKLQQRILETSPPCRFEKFSICDGEVDVILDSSHNPKAVEELFARLWSVYPENSTNLQIVFSISSDKAISDVLDSIKKCLEKRMKNDFYSTMIITQANSTRTLPVEELRAVYFQKSSLVRSAKSVSEAMEMAKQQALAAKRIGNEENKEVILVFGTMFMMLEARLFLGVKDEDVDDVDIVQHEVERMTTKKLL